MNCNDNMIYVFYLMGVGWMMCIGSIICVDSVDCMAIVVWWM